LACGAPDFLQCSSTCRCICMALGERSTIFVDRFGRQLEGFFD